MPQDLSTSPSTVILDLDSALHHSALIESLTFLERLSNLLPRQSDVQSLVQQTILRLSYLTLHLRIPGETRLEIQLLRHQSMHRLAEALERRTDSQSLPRSIRSAPPST